MKKIKSLFTAYFVFVIVACTVSLYMFLRLSYSFYFLNDLSDKTLFYVTRVHPELEFNKTHDSITVDLDTWMLSFWVWNPRDFAVNKLLFDEVNSVHIPPKVVPVYTEEEIRNLISQDKKAESESK